VEKYGTGRQTTDDSIIWHMGFDCVKVTSMSTYSYVYKWVTFMICRDKYIIYGLGLKV